MKGIGDDGSVVSYIGTLVLVGCFALKPHNSASPCEELV